MLSSRIKKNGSGRGMDIKHSNHNFRFLHSYLCTHMIHYSSVGCPIVLLVVIFPLGVLWIELFGQL